MMTTTSYQTYSALEAAELRIRQAGEWLNLDDGLIETIVAPRRILEVAIPFRRDDGTRDQLTGECTTTPPVVRPKAASDITKMSPVMKSLLSQLVCR